MFICVNASTMHFGYRRAVYPKDDTIRHIMNSFSSDAAKFVNGHQVYISYVRSNTQHQQVIHSMFVAPHHCVVMQRQVQINPLSSSCGCYRALDQFSPHQGGSSSSIQRIVLLLAHNLDVHHQRARIKRFVIPRAVYPYDGM